MHGESLGERQSARRSGGSVPTRLDDVRLVPRSAEVPADADAQAALHAALDGLVRLIEQQLPSMRGSVLLLDEDGVTLRHGAAPHLPLDYCQAIDGASIGPAAGSCGTAAYRRERVVVSDIATDPLWADYKALALRHGLRACWSTPILDARGAVLGTFAMYYGEPRLPGAVEEALTRTATLLAGNIIVRARTERQLRERTEAAERAVRALADSERRMRVLCEAIPVHVWTATPDGSLDFVADRVVRDFGMPAERLLGSGWTSAVHPEDVERAGAAWQRALLAGEPYEVEFRVRAGATGEYRWQLVRALPFRDETGAIVRWYGTNTDIEAQKRAESARDAARAEAEHANRVKSQFLAMMSHELRTPLNAIGGFAKLMLDGIPTPASEGQQNYLRRIVKGQEHLLGLIDAVLTHAKLEAGRMTYRVTNIRMGELLETVEAMVGPQLAAKRIAYDCGGCDGTLVLRGDRQKVVQILLNVLSNAVKFTPEGGRILARTAVPSPGRAAIGVRDTGVGMTAQQLATVFEPFVQFDNRLSHEAKGTGLGMPISRELARGMGGDLTVESEPGVGTEFVLVLPTDAQPEGVH